ncbi:MULTISPECIES: ATP-dependent DNA helicase RecG [unclassified Curtobacterium]|uniref:ATP-dependent DNA helicase RecG n=1 Tax=unclassified Curtobacterium TaxID=257496 RepID=UPI0008DDB8B6|nr:MULTISPECIES: ATP-dependent DNA helicase RecG [unclassified Curtobacterium]OIH97126.1 ATP-dependent DNA helicase RecG [Curtobacterium sp. MCBA15_003]OII15107.1 ATP-dependent DNA helicase RecG [Curtobacterium sp. MCBA15_009]OII33003.1 ATP-dependent DNA helicase RecG [Curtobacterium sp. MMLR14_006]
MPPAADLGPAPLDARLASVLGGRTASAIEKAFGYRTVGEFLEHAPRRYAERGALTALDSLAIGEPVTIVAEVVDVRERTMRARRGSILEAKIGDGKGLLTLTFFNQGWRTKDLVPGARGIFAGKVSDYRGARQLAHPDYELFDADDPRATAEPGSDEAIRWSRQPIPIYPATASLSSWQIAKSIAIVLDTLPDLPDPVPAAARGRLDLVPFRRALELLHRPEKVADFKRAQDALRYREAFVLQTALVQRRIRSRRTAATARVASPGGILERFDATLPFELTDDQRTVGAEVDQDLARTWPMHRLVQGEVGSGKTLVAIRAMLTVAESGGQSALIAPTEVLAAQHLRSIVKFLGPDLAAELRPVILTGSQSTDERRRALLAAASGSSRLVVGTHALLGDRVDFAELGLVVVDEQHRFGVEQREALRTKGATPPHVLVLTATPIPRTVAMTVFGDLDVSTITGLPSGRAGVETFTVPLAEHPGWESRIWSRMAEELDKGRQAFVVCPAIDDAHTEDDGEPAPTDAAAEPDAPKRAPATVLATAERMRTIPVLAGRRIAVLHGRMTADEKDRVMTSFAAGDLDVLVATTVIEVGVDVPNAAMMAVLDADRFGVSQLHQLRGRIGRGQWAGVCLLVTTAELETTSRERVDAVSASDDGFELARVDLELRREGDVLGERQSGGRSSLNLLRVVEHADLIVDARGEAERVLERDPDLQGSPALREALGRRLDESDAAFLGKN